MQGRCGGKKTKRSALVEFTLWSLGAGERGNSQNKQLLENGKREREKAGRGVEGGLGRGP